MNCLFQHKLVSLLVFIFVVQFLGVESVYCQKKLNDKSRKTDGIFVVEKSFAKIPRIVFGSGKKESGSVLELPSKKERESNLEKKFDSAKSVLWISFENKLKFNDLVKLIESVDDVTTIVIESTIYPDLDANGKFYSAVRSCLSDGNIRRLMKKFPRKKVKRSASVKPIPPIAY